MVRRRTLRAALVRLWGTLSRRRKAQFYALLVIMVAASVAEIFSLGMVVPFLAALTEPQKVFANPAVQAVLQHLPPMTAPQLVVWVGVAFCTATLLAGTVRVLLLYANSGFSFALGADLSLEVYRRTLYQPYPVHVSRNSSTVISGVINKTNAVINNVLGQLLSIASAAILLLGILGALFAINPIVTLAAIAAFAIIYGVIIRRTRQLLRRASDTIADESTRIQKALQEGLGGIRDVLIDGTQETFSRIYAVADRRLRAAQGRVTLTVGAPRFIVEALGMIFIAALAVTVSGSGADPNVVPVLGALALGAQRLLPIVQQAYAAIVTIRGSESSLWDVIELLDQPLPQSASGEAPPVVAFERELRLDRVSFAFSAEAGNALTEIDLIVPRGARVGISGPTGGGKSTTLDLIMGLLEPTCGAVLIDGLPLTAETRRGWQRHIAHVPQSIYLSDSSIAENIAFGQPKGVIDMARVVRAAEQAQIAATIGRWPDGYETPVGERGIRLSGGERQRVGIARALYKMADVLVLDEATSALDTDTERDLMSAIDSLSRDLTIIMVAHRLTTLKDCDILITIAGGRATVVADQGPRAAIGDHR